jgi:hypothetical protein
MKKLIISLSLAVLYLSSSTAFSQTTFTGSNSTNWADTGNWDNGLPAAGNDATIPAGLTAENFNGPFNVYWSIHNNGTINNNGVIRIYGGIITNHGIINNYSSLYNYSSFQGFGHIINSGTINNHSAINNQSTIDNFGAIILIHTGFNTGLIDNNSGGTIDNFGTIDNSLGAPLLNTGTIDNLGIIDNFGALVNQGTIYNCYGVYIGNLPYPTPLVEIDCPFVEGCLDAAACNYDSTSTLDDGSCEFISCNSGCTYASATNYDSAVTIDDGTCAFECPDITSDNQAVYDEAYAAGIAAVCPGDFSGDGHVNVSDLGGFLGAFGTQCE